MSNDNRLRSQPLLTLLLLVLVSLASALALGRRAPAPPAADEHIAVTASGSPVSRSATVEDPAALGADERTAATTSAAPNALDPTTPLDFNHCVERLRELGELTARHAEQDEIDAAKESDAAARELFDRLMRTFPDAGERALNALSQLADDSDDRRDHGRRIVLQLVLTNECVRRDELATHTDNRRPVDALVQALLDSLPINAVLADVGAAVLGDSPYLRATHEPSVLALVRLAATGDFSRPVATKLLTTLWDNLQRTGERSSNEISSLALLWLDDADPSQRTAACRQLMLDRRYRALVLARIRERQDFATAGQVANAAANELPPLEALGVLCELTPLTKNRATFLGLGARAPGVLADAYRQHLASNTHADVRAELVFGVGMLPGQTGLEIAELAIANDPDPNVRLQALLGLSANAETARAEAAMMQLLDDPAIANNRRYLGTIVGALRNLEFKDPHAIDRVGRRLRNSPLSEQSRQELAAILDRSLPSGFTGGLPEGALRRGF